MKILILGATGRTGRLLVEEAVKQGYQINVLVRNENKLTVTSASITVFQGIPVNQQELVKAMQGCDAILSTLNISRTSDFPWAALRTPKDFLSGSMKNIIETADELKIKRIIITTAWGTNETKKDIPWWFAWLIDHSNIGYAYRDHEVQEDLLKASSLNYTIVRPSGLTNSLKNKTVMVSLNNVPAPGLTISRKNVALFMLDTLKNNLYQNQCPAIS
ncbi:MAG: NAD(P)H-binding protein [Bacteroidota bacterium]